MGVVTFACDRSLFRVDIPVGARGPWLIRRQTATEPCVVRGVVNPPGTYTILSRRRPPIVDGDPTTAPEPTIWMSDAPTEVEEAVGFVERAHGHVLVTGLGLGSILKPLLANPGVDTVTVVELDFDVVDLVWPTYQRDPKLSLVYGDALKIPAMTFDCAWHDIWPNVFGGNVVQMIDLRKRFPVRDFSMCWAEGHCLADLERGMSRIGLDGASIRSQCERLLGGGNACRIDESGGDV